MLADVGRAVLAWLAAHPELVAVLMTAVVWPALTGAASYADEWLARRAPTLAAILRAGGFDAKRFLAILGELARRKVPRLPIPPEVIEATSRRSVPPAKDSDPTAVP
jgi:hypothetical protein